jgi:hypothetical protein
MMRLSELLNKGAASNAATPIDAILIGADWSPALTSRRDFPILDYFWELRGIVDHPITHERQRLLEVLRDLGEKPDWPHEKIVEWLYSIGR